MQVASVTVQTTGAPPVITAQPTNSVVCLGDAATFRVAANGSAPLLYQWRKNGANIPGAQSSVFTIAHSTATDADLVIDTTRKSPETIVNAIVHAFSTEQSV